MSKEKTFGEKVRALRTELNLSQEQLSKQLDVSFATINRWEGGKAKPQKAQLDAVQKMLDEAGIHDDAEDSVTADGTNAVRPRQRRGVPKSSVLSTKSMEQMLWDA